MPDFDIDFCIEGRQSVKDYVVRKYGKDYVSEIIAFDTLKARAAVRDTGRAMDLPYALCDRVSKLIPSDYHITLERALAESAELQKLHDENHQVSELLKYAKQLEGMPRHASVHAAGVVISAVPVAELVPLQKNDDSVVTQYTMGILEQLGLLKMDFLGLRNLTVIRETERSIQKRVHKFSMTSIPENDPAVFTMLGKGDSIGVFQMESDGLRRVLMQMKPKSIADLTAVISLYRPGPMDSIPQYLAARSDPAKVRYDHPLLEPILKETFGCIVYQEQVMEICRTLAGYSYGRADLVRRAMAKKKHEVMEKERKIFVHGGENCPGAVANGVPEETANAIFDRMAAFASYAFNKSHAAAYARVAYETAYLKCRYPLEYFAALMTSVMGYTPKLIEYISIAENAGISILKPDINKSSACFSAEPEGIRFGLLALKGLGEAAIAAYISERETNGSYRSLQDFCERNAGAELNKRAVESLIRSGSFDGLGWYRSQMLSIYEQLISAQHNQTRSVISGQLSLFGSVREEKLPVMQAPDVPEFPEQTLLQMEKEVTGLFLSGHPLSGYHAMRVLLRLPEIADAVSLKDQSTASVLCMVSEYRRHMTKKGEQMCYLTVRDFSGELECLVFPSLYQSVAALLHEDAVIWVRGKISKKDGDGVRLFCEGILSEKDFLNYARGMQLCCKVVEPAEVNRILSVCRRFPGDTPICFYLTKERKYLRSKSQTGVLIDNSFLKQLSDIIPASQAALIPKEH